MEQRSLTQIWADVEAAHKCRPRSACECVLGEQVIVKPDGATPSAPAFYIMGFNGGETPPKTCDAGPVQTRSAKRWFDLCQRAADSVGVASWLIIEQCHWGSPNIATLKQRLGSKATFRDMLRLHAEANLAYFAVTPPRLVWMTGFAAVREAEEDYSLTPVGSDPVMRTIPLKGILWREYANADRVPFIMSRHPTGARAARGEHDRVFAKLREAAASR